jgi:hypothetical protein
VDGNDAIPKAPQMAKATGSPPGARQVTAEHLISEANFFQRATTGENGIEAGVVGDERSLLVPLRNF